MTAVVVGGLDPGPKPGMVMLRITTRRPAACDEGSDLVNWDVVVAEGIDQLLACDYLAVERYVLQARSGMRKDKGAQTATLTMAEDTYHRALVTLGRSRVQYLGPGNVKPWATDQRLERYGLAVVGGHHRDALRHALYLAARRGLLPKL